jgi:hypothetical protein
MMLFDPCEVCVCFDFQVQRVFDAIVSASARRGIAKARIRYAVWTGLIVAWAAYAMSDCAVTGPSPWLAFAVLIFFVLLAWQALTIGLYFRFRIRLLAVELHPALTLLHLSFFVLTSLLLALFYLMRSCPAATEE